MRCGHEECHLFGAFSCIICDIEVCWVHVERHEDCGISDTEEDKEDEA